MADETVTKNVVTKISVEAAPGLDRPFRQIEEGAGKAHASVGRLANGMATDLRKLDRGIMSVNHGFMGLSMASMMMGQSFQNSSPHMKKFVEHAQQAAGVIAVIHSSMLLLRGSMMVFSVLTAGVSRYAAAALAAASANFGLARSHQAVAAAAGQQAAAQAVAAGVGRAGLAAALPAAGIGGIVGGLAGYGFGGATGHEGAGTGLGATVGTIAAVMALQKFGPALGRFGARALGARLGAAAPAAPAAAARVLSGYGTRAVATGGWGAGMWSGGTAIGPYLGPTTGTAIAPAAGSALSTSVGAGVAAGGGAAAGGAAAAGGMTVGGALGLVGGLGAAVLGAHEVGMWGVAGLGKATGLWDSTQFARRHSLTGSLYDWYDESWNRQTKLDKGLEASQRQKILTASILQTAIQERRVREPFVRQQEGLIDERALVGIEAARLRFDTRGAARARQAGYRGRFGAEIARTLGEKSLADTPEERAYRANLQDQAERLAEHMGLSSQQARAHVEDAAARQRYFSGKAQATGRELAQAEATTKAYEKQQTSPEYLKALEHETHLRSQVIDYTHKAQEAQKQYVDALRQEKDVTAQNEQQFRSFAAEQERHYRQIRQQQEAKIKGLKMDFAFMDPTEIDKMSQMAQRFVNEIQNPKQGRRGQIAMVGGRARFVPGTVGGFTHEEMQYIKGNPFFDQLREKYADKVTANNPALQKLLEMTGQTEKLEAAARQEKLFADIKLQVQNKVDMELRLNAEDVAEQIKNKIQQPIAEMIRQLGDQMERQVHIHGVIQRATPKAALGG